MEPLRIHLFGGFLLEQGDRVLPPIPSRAGRSLFAYLVMHRDRRHQRELLAGSFWPDLPESRARRRLSHVLWQIQDVLGETEAGSAYLATTADVLAFDPEVPYWLDVEEFDRRLSQLDTPGTTWAAADASLQELRACVELYRGDFMAGFYDEWVELPQQHYRERYLGALSRLVQTAKSQGNHQEALAYARRLTHHDPLREEAHQEVIRLCFLLGRTGEALRQYERCRSVLEEELGTEPSQATVELYRKILRHRRAGTRPAGAGAGPVLFDARNEAPFVGREVERRALVDATERVLGGRGGVILVEGEPGVGKSRLAMESVEDAQWRGFEVLWGAAREGSTGPYGPLAEALTNGLTHLRAEQLAQRVDAVWLSEVARLVPILSELLPDLPDPVRLRSGEEPARMQEALARVFTGLGEITPHLLVLDDLHWADDETLRVLSRMAPFLAQSRLAILILYRSEEGRGDPRVWDVLRELDRTAGVGRVVLAPLSVFEVGEMVKRSLGLPKVEADLATRLHRETGGNALFTLETLHALRDQGLVDEATGDLSPAIGARLEGSVPVPDRIRSVIADRVSLLPEQSRAVLVGAAVVGVPVGLEVLVDVADQPRVPVLEAVDDLLGRRLLSEEDELLAISHDQIRQVVYEAVPHHQRRELHRRAARALAASSPENVEVLARHFSAGQLPDEAARYLEAAGQRALELHAYGTAASRFRTAVEMAEDAGWSRADRFRLLTQLEWALNVLGRREEQEAALEEMAELTGDDLALQAEAARRRSLLLAHTDRFAEAAETAERAVELAAACGDRSAEAAGLVALGMSLRWSGRPTEAVPHLEDAVALAAGDDEREAEARTALANTLTELQRYEAAAENLRRAYDLFEQLEDLRGQAEVLGVLAMGSMERGQTEEAEAGYRQALDLCRRIGYRHGEGVNLVNLANLLYFSGRLGEALQRYDEAASVFETMGNQRGQAMVLANSAAVRHAVLGDEVRASADTKTALAYFHTIGDEVGEAQCAGILAGIAARQGDHVTARKYLTESLHKLAGRGHRWLRAQHLLQLALLELTFEGVEAARGPLAHAEELATEAELEPLMADLRSVQAVYHAKAGDAEMAVELSTRAVSALHPGAEQPHLVWLRHFEVLHNQGLVSEARRAIERAHDALDSMMRDLEPEVVRQAWESVPEHRKIKLSWEQTRPLRREMWLPAADAPTGRPLRDDEVRRVQWTIESPEDAEVADPVTKRRVRILRLVREAEVQGALPTMELLAEVLGVSEATIRRDLRALRKAGHLVSTRGQRSA